MTRLKRVHRSYEFQVRNAVLVFEKTCLFKPNHFDFQTWESMLIYIYIYMYVFIYVYICLYIYIYMCKYICILCMVLGLVAGLNVVIEVIVVFSY